MTRRISLLVLFALMSHSAGSMQAVIARTSTRIFNLWTTPLSKYPQEAERILVKEFVKNPGLGYRLALCKSLLGRNLDEILPFARSAAESDHTGIAQYYYGVLLERKGSSYAREWYNAAGKNGIGWEEFIRDEQHQINGHE